MKHFSTIAAVLVILASSGFAQHPTKLTPKSRQATQKELNRQWTLKIIDKFSIKSVMIPDDMVEEDGVVDSSAGGSVTSTSFSQTWTKLPHTEVNLEITVWDGDFAMVTGESAEIATPENLLAVDLFGDTNNKNEAGSKLAQAGYHEVDGVNGELVQIDLTSSSIFVWATYKYFLGKAQRIKITVELPKKEPKIAMKIIDSLKFEKELDN